MHFEDQLSSEKKCGHLGGKVLVPTQQAVRNLIAGEQRGSLKWSRLALVLVCSFCRLAADVPVVLIAALPANHSNHTRSPVLTRSPPGGRRGGRAHGADCAHRRALRQPADLRCG